MFCMFREIMSIHVKSSKAKNVFPGISPGNLPAVSEKQVGMDGRTDGRNIMPIAERAIDPVS